MGKKHFTLLDKFEEIEETKEEIEKEEIEETKEKEKIEKEELKYRTLSRLNIRREPDGVIMDVVEKDTILEVEKIEDGWAQLKDKSFCMAKYLEQID